MTFESFFCLKFQISKARLTLVISGEKYTIEVCSRKQLLRYLIQTLNQSTQEKAT